MPALSHPLSDGLVTLRLAAERDIPEVLIAYQDDPDMHRWLGEDLPPSGAQLGSRAERTAGDLAAGRGARLSMLLDGHDECRGQIEVHGIDWVNLRAELGIWVAPAVRGRGVARGALALTARWIFDAWRLERLAVLTHPANLPMLHAARAAGFLEEGTLRAYARTRDGRADRTVLSLLPGDLPAVASPRR